MKNIIKFVGEVAGIIAASIVIDKIVDKIYESTAENTAGNADTSEESVDACKKVVKAAAVAAVLIISNKNTAKKVRDVSFKYGVEGGIRCAASAFINFGLSRESGSLLLNDPDALIRFRDKVLPAAVQSYFG